MRIVVAEDSALVREGLVRLLRDAGEEVVAAVPDGRALVAAVAEHGPDLAIVDVRMPPTFTDEGARAAAQVREGRPGQAILVLSQDIEPSLIELSRGAGGFGYLLKDRVLDVDEFLDTAARIAHGGSALDPKVVATLVAPHTGSPLERLSERERSVLKLMAEGLTNAAIAQRLVVSQRTVEAHVRHVLLKLDIPENEEGHRRVLAVLTHLRSVREWS
jgi:DNA-binding NarL/FixJ family response regulator